MARALSGRTVPVSEQLALPLKLGGRRSGPACLGVGGRLLRFTECFDAYWRFAAERQRIFHLRASGAAAPWTADPILAAHKFTSVYRAADRVSQYLIREVIYTGTQDRDELVFRVLPFKLFNKIDIWELLIDRLGARPAWTSYEFAAYDQIPGEAIGSGQRIYSAAYIIANPPFGHARKHGHHLRLIQHAMTSGLPQAITSAAGMRELYQLLAALPSLGPFLAYQLAIDLAYSPSQPPGRTSSSSPGQGHWTGSPNASPAPAA